MAQRSSPTSGSMLSVEPVWGFLSLSLHSLPLSPACSYSLSLSLSLSLKRERENELPLESDRPGLNPSWTISTQNDLGHINVLNFIFFFCKKKNYTTNINSMGIMLL